jgi:hypothetical protein
MSQMELNAFLRGLRLHEEDFVVIKMDIEGGEYDCLEALISEPELTKVVDELFVEVGYTLVMKVCLLRMRF